MKYLLVTVLALNLLGCGQYLDSLKKDKAKKKPSADLTISEIRNLDNVKEDGAKSCWVGTNAITEIMRNVFPVGTHELNLQESEISEVAEILGDDMPKLDSYSTYVIPDINQVLRQNNIEFDADTPSIPIKDWDFGAVTVGKNHIFFVLGKPKVEPFYTDKVKDRYGIPHELEASAAQRADFVSLLAHELTHIVQMRQAKAQEKVQKSCVIQNGVEQSDRYDYSISGVNDLFKLGMEASAEFVENTIILKHSLQSSSHDLERDNKSIAENYGLHLEKINQSTGF